MDYVTNSETKSYMALLKTTEESQKFKLQFSFTSSNATPQIAVKNCLTWDCKFITENFKGKEPKSDKETFFKFNKAHEMHKTIDYEITCDENSSV